MSGCSASGSSPGLEERHIQRVVVSHKGVHRAGCFVERREFIIYDAESAKSVPKIDEV
jgi:hypothetical protein